MFKRFFVFLSITFFILFSICYASAKININKDGIEKLMELKGVGKSYAQRIVEYREKNGPFKNINDLKNIKGIGEKIILKNKDTISLEK